MKWVRFRQLLLVALVAVLIWLLQDELAPKVSIFNDQQIEMPDYSMKGFVISAFNQKGLASYYLQAEKMEHYDSKAVMELVHPYFITDPQAGEQWYVLADRGQVFEEGGKIWLFGNVRVERPASGVRFMTEKLFISPGQEYIETDLAVSFYDNDSKIEAVGMRGFLKEQRIEFLANVRSRYHVE